MPNKITKERWSQLVKEHRAGKSIADIVRENEDVKKSTFRYHIKKANVEDENEEQMTDQEPTTSQELETRQETKNETETKTEVARIVPRVQVRDDFLSSLQPAKSSTVDSLFGDSFFGQSQHRNHGSVDNMFSLDDIFNPDTLKQVDVAPEKPKSALGKSKSWWLSTPAKEKTKTEIALQEDEEQLILVQKIRLYFVHFPELSKLHIVPLKKGTDEPDTEKWLISLYSKKQDGLEKILNFVRFHVRNNISENSSIKLASNALETSVKVLEHVLLLVGVQSQDLTKTVMSDPDIIRCVKEILIDNSITSLSLGPKSDLLLKLGMKIVSTDSHNRIERQMEANAQTKAEEAKATSRAEPLNEVLAAKYQDL